MSSFLLFGIGITAFAQRECKLRKDEDSIRVYTCSTDTSKFKSIKVECVLNTSLKKLESALLDFNNYTHWQFNTTESRALKKLSDNEFIYYARVEAPWPVSDRDMVVLLKLTQSKGQLLISANSKQGIFPEQKDLLRVPASSSHWEVTEKKKNRLEVKYALQIDPGGSVPAWLVNWVCANAPLQSFKKLKKELEK